jgi:hypothetical protein
MWSLCSAPVTRRDAGYAGAEQVHTSRSGVHTREAAVCGNAAERGEVDEEGRKGAW